MVLDLQCHVCVDSVQLSTQGHPNGYPSWSSSGEKWIETGVFMILASQLFNLGDLSGDPWFRFGLFFKLSPRSLPLKTVQQHGSLIPGRQELAFIREPKAWIYKFGWGKKTLKKLKMTFPVTTGKIWAWRQKPCNNGRIIITYFTKGPLLTFMESPQKGVWAGPNGGGTGSSDSPSESKISHLGPFSRKKPCTKMH